MMGDLSALQPWFLVAGLGALVPLVIHLIERRRLQRVMFGSVWFLRGLVRKLARRRRTSELVLLALRMAIIAVLALALSRPFFRPNAGAAGASAGKAEAVLVDCSASMKIGRRMAQAKKSALAAIDHLRDGDSVAVFAYGPRLETVTSWSTDRAAARAAVETLAARDQLSDLAGALQRVNETIADRLEHDKEITVCSDMQAVSWENYRGEWRLAPGVALVLVDVEEGEKGAGPPPVNVGIVRIGVASKAVAGSEPEVLTAQVRNYSDKRREVTVDLLLQGKKVDTRSVGLPPGSSSSVSFRHEFTRADPAVVAKATMAESAGEGVRDVDGEFVLGVEDDFAADNQAWFVVQVSPKIKVVLVNGSSDPAPKSNDGYFLKRALAPSRESIFEVEEVTPEAFAATLRVPMESGGEPKLDGVGAVVLSDVTTLSDDALRKLRLYVQQGGGVMFFVGTQTRPEAFNGLFAGLAPCRLEGLVDVVPVADHRDGVVISEMDLQNPIFQPFSKPYYGDFTRVHFKRYFSVTDSQAAQVLARFDDRNPAVLLKRIGKGQSLLVVSSADLEMNDFCLRGVFLPFVHQSVRLLAAYGETAASDLRTGTEASVELPAGAASARLTSPAGASVTLRAEPLGEPIAPAKDEGSIRNGASLPDVVKETGTVSYGTVSYAAKPVVRFAAAEQGIYRLSAGGADRLFAANMDPKEGDFAKLRPDEVTAALTRQRGVAGGPDSSGEGGALRVETARLHDEDFEKSQRIGWILLLLAAGVLTTEIALADRISKGADVPV